MAASFLSTLPKSLRQAWPIVQRGVREGLSSRAVQSVLSQAGLGVRRQVLLDGMRLLREGFAQQKTLRLLPPGIRPPLRLIPASLTRIRRSFSYTLEIVEVIGDRAVTRFMTLSSNDLLNQREAQAMASEALVNDTFKYGRSAELVSVEMTGMLKAGQLGTL